MRGPASSRQTTILNPFTFTLKERVVAVALIIPQNVVEKEGDLMHILIVSNVYLMLFCRDIRE